MKPQLYFVFDVESVGLLGNGFAWGAVVVDETGKELWSDYACIRPSTPLLNNHDQDWIESHVLPYCPITHYWPSDIRPDFWQAWCSWQNEGALLCADVAWPVEARFLLSCVDSGKCTRSDAPYPLLDIASIRFAKGLDPLETCERLESELPAHNPLNDARQSARLLIEALNRE